MSKGIDLIKYEDICRDKILEGLSSSQLAEKYNMTPQGVNSILRHHESQKFIKKYRKARTEISNEQIEAVKNLAGKVSSKLFNRVLDIAEEMKEIECPHCKKMLQIKANNATSLRAALAGLGVAGIKLKQDEDIPKEPVKIEVITSKANKPKLTVLENKEVG